ncbi:Methylisocitrate lyase [Pseudonocardia sp. Ae168_Ps1]|uniref:isocitrate lyase/phosphoenolpyruvate mutase family protein n=1 Tax=unclassified Pseudonocardia TaxID=2619320 RepID=UPI00094B5857|nr:MULTISPECIES: isocitrate lyase/phosphoenolpyruvate mutase family protein [unclassified Pseudonocardia]OLL74465.1 Methylisocitrate lyase [Pseudonocardia sp. Ae150A_Ps1]OLL80445.1 Methylisocitrate lyase [Pseudonocardia sp. Ae168_Ps1]OLL85428.1 Methylisocitrate lyase [Pseudonocardia sp. Ae263_Ps1]OLL94545.1 Methylisocitrate lyase [Pseudonocardia sp. Ae356_Ps1]
MTTSAAAPRSAACGLDGVHLSWDLLATQVGRPTTAPAGLPEIVARTAEVVQATSLPVLVDLGNAAADVHSRAALAHTVQVLEEAGATGVYLDDVVTGERSSGPGPADADDVTARVRTAVRARRDPDFLIGARTTVRAEGGLIDSVDRARACVGAGADLIVVEAPNSDTAYTVFREALSVPLLATTTTTTTTTTVAGSDPTSVPPLTVPQLATFGMDVVIHPVTPAAGTGDRHRPWRPGPA